MIQNFSHFDHQGNAIMVDVGDKEKTTRQATAIGQIRMSAECYDTVQQGLAKKGDVLGVARIAGIMAVKQTSSLIPLCHPLPIDMVRVDFRFDEGKHVIIADCSVKTTAVTGVEMEALVGVSATLLTIYDMCKAIDKSMEIETIKLMEKTGGKSGVYRYGERGNNR